jgi:predicted O-methyltransferase YrrM
MQMLPWQMGALYALAWSQCHEGGHILEIGTGSGSSAYMLAQAAPTAEIVTITPNAKEAELARQFLRGATGGQVRVWAETSAAFLPYTVGCSWDLIYVDADHRHCQADLPWFNRLVGGGLILFHDYSPRACPPVYAAVGALARRLGRGPDVELMDSEGIGMAGFIRQVGEEWPQ